MSSAAEELAQWATDLKPAEPDLALADRSLADTLAVALAARQYRVTRLAASLPDGARWAVAAHVLDFDDLHMPSTTHISAVCVPAALATGGDARAYLAGGRRDGPARAPRWAGRTTRLAGTPPAPRAPRPPRPGRRSRSA